MTSTPAPRGDVRVSSRVRWWPRVWVLVLGLVLLGPALLPGYVLSYDMVWVPKLALRSEVWGLGALLPRNVPSDALVAMANTVLPGMLIQKCVLVAATVGAGLAGLRFGGASLLGRTLAGTVYLWNPFVVERLAIGHWPLLISYAVLPVLLTHAEHFRRHREVRPALIWSLVAACLTPSAGVMAFLVLIVTALDWRLPRFRPASAPGWRSVGYVVALGALANAPWVTAGLAHVQDARSTVAGGSVFGLSAEGSLSAPLAALGLGGIWNSDVVPWSRATPIAGLALLLFLPLGGLGLWLIRHLERPMDLPLRHVSPSRDHAYDLIVLWVFGYGLAVMTWAAPGLMGWLAGTVPGGGLMRDGARWLALCAPLVATTVAVGGVWLTRRTPAAVRGLVALLLVGLPVLTLPDAAFGLSGALRPATYPSEYAAVRTLLVNRARDVVYLPYSPYRAPDWNHNRPVLDPLPRYLSANPIVSDQLSVNGRRIEGESRYSAKVRSALSAADPAQGLRDLGLRYVVIDKTAPGPRAKIEGQSMWNGDRLRVLDLGPTTVQTQPRAGARGLVGLGWLGFAALLVYSVVVDRRSN